MLFLPAKKYFKDMFKMKMLVQAIVLVPAALVYDYDAVWSESVPAQSGNGAGQSIPISRARFQARHLPSLSLRHM